MNKHPLLSIPVALLLATSAFADFISGTVVDANGVPVAGLNIDAIRVSNGNNTTLTGDSTNAAGAFLTTIPAGVYDLIFYPPSTTMVPLVLRTVVVAGTTNLGTLHLQASWTIAGHVQTEAGAPLGQVDLVLTDLATGFEVPQAQKVTDAFGNFVLVSPRNAVSVGLDATDLVIPVVASREIELTPSANTNLGNLTLPNGFRVSGHVQRSSNGLALSGVDLDFRGAGGSLYTPNDNTNSLGNFTVTVPAGTYDIDFSAPVETLLAGERLANRSVSGTLALGTIALDPGAVLSGTIRSHDNLLQVNADVDVYRQSTGELVPTSGDHTNAAGAYQTIVPLDTLRVVFRPPSFSVPLSSDVRPNVLVTVNTTLNGVLPACAAPNNYGAGLAGTGGIVPHLTFSGGTTRDGNSAFAYELQGGRGGALSVLTVSPFQRSVPFRGGTLLVETSTSLSIRVVGALGGSVGVAGAGSRRVPFPIGLATGFHLYAQFAVRDPAAVQGFAFSDGLHFRVCP